MASTGTARIAAILTCHNRREQTLECLRSLQVQQAGPRGGFQLSVYLVDDGSTDGTADAVRARFPGTRVIAGDGSLFWAGGMRRGMEKAMPEGYDFYLWVNDDTRLEPHAVRVLLETSHRVTAGRHDAIVAGCIRDPATGGVSYGGVVRTSRFKPLHFHHLPAADEPRRCDTMNANCVLVPGAVVKVLGNLDRAFPHSIADFDYGLRARRRGIAVWSAPGFVGTCALNTGTGAWRNPALPFRARWKLLTSEKGLPPRAWRIFTRRHAALLWPAYFAAPYANLALSSLAGVFRQSRPAAAPGKAMLPAREE